MPTHSDRAVEHIHAALDRALEDTFTQRPFPHAYSVVMERARRALLEQGIPTHLAGCHLHMGLTQEAVLGLHYRAHDGAYHILGPGRTSGWHELRDFADTLTDASTSQMGRGARIEHAMGEFQCEKFLATQAQGWDNGDSLRKPLELSPAPEGAVEDGFIQTRDCIAQVLNEAWDMAQDFCSWPAQGPLVEAARRVLSGRGVETRLRGWSMHLNPAGVQPQTLTGWALSYRYRQEDYLLGVGDAQTLTQVAQSLVRRGMPWQYGEVRNYQVNSYLTASGNTLPGIEDLAARLQSRMDAIDLAGNTPYTRLHHPRRF